ncbi:MAG: 3-deoxy-7-phosphoheptulonate synthase [Bacteroidetes bacterium]|nr:MAG: 3-deoxy-7-phosphoheptulonate synthase [Bacteroidota bacterium]
MIIKLKNDATAEDLQRIEQTLARHGWKGMPVTTQYRRYLVGIGKKAIDLRQVGHLSGIEDVFRVTDSFKLVSRKWRIEETCIDLGDGVRIGAGHFALMAGPCSIESEQQVADTIAHLQAHGIRIMRGGVYKPRSSPYSFRGLGIEGLKMWHEQAAAAGIKIITEVMMPRQIEEMYPYVDIFQVGARNAQNFNLLDALGEVDKPVLLKRGISGTIEELLQSAEYIFSGGNERILLCERGIRTYEKAYRNCFDINAVAILKERTHLPVIADPSHGVGLRHYVPQVALAAVMAGADGVIMEVHRCPEEAFSDGQQTLDFKEAALLYRKLAMARQALQAMEALH